MATFERHLMWTHSVSPHWTEAATKRPWDWGQESWIPVLALPFDQLCDLGLNYELRELMPPPLLRILILFHYKCSFKLI